MLLDIDVTRDLTTKSYPESSKTFQKQFTSKSNICDRPFINFLILRIFFILDR